MALNKASDVPAADWPSQTHVKNYRNFSCVVIRFFSVVEISTIEHTSLYSIYTPVYIIYIYIALWHKNALPYVQIERSTGMSHCP